VDERSPLTAPPVPSASPAPKSDFAVRHPARILVVDDNPINRRVALRLLENLGYQPTFAVDGESALGHLRENPCDLVLMDDQMPGLSGPECTAEIRRQLPVERQPVIVALTANALEGDRERYLGAGMDEYLTKPLHLDHLTGLLARLLELRDRLHARLGGDLRGRQAK